MVEQIVNGGFETGSDTSHAPPWVLSGPLRDNSTSHTGTWSVNIYSQQAYQSIGNIPVNNMTHFNLWAKMSAGNDPNTYVRVTYSDATHTDVSLSNIGIAWAQKDILGYLTAGKIVTQIFLQGGTTQPCWVDDVSMDAPNSPSPSFIGGGPKNLGFMWFLLSVASSGYTTLQTRMRNMSIKPALQHLTTHLYQLYPCQSPQNNLVL